MKNGFSGDALDLVSVSGVSAGLERIGALASAPLSDQDRLAIRDLAQALHRRLMSAALGASTAAPRATGDARRDAVIREDARLNFI